MTILGGFDVHRKQITYDYVDTSTGEVRSGQICPAVRTVLRSWLAKTCAGNDAEFAVDACQSDIRGLATAGRDFRVGVGSLV